MNLALDLRAGWRIMCGQGKTAMISDNELFAAIASAVREVEQSDISIAIATRDIRKAVATFNAQETELVTVTPV